MVRTLTSLGLKIGTFLMAITPTLVGFAQTTTYVAPQGQIIALRSSVAACARGGVIVPFEEPAIQVNGVAFAFTPNPPSAFPGGAAMAALYANAPGQAAGQPQGQFCVDGACLANGNSCSAIAFIQPNTVRVYVRQ